VQIWNSLSKQLTKKYEQSIFFKKKKWAEIRILKRIWTKKIKSWQFFNSHMVASTVAPWLISRESSFSYSSIGSSFCNEDLSFLIHMRMMILLKLVMVLLLKTWSNHWAVKDTATNEDPNETDARKNTYKRKPRRKTFIVWNHFEEVEVGGIKKNQCKWCKNKFTKSKLSCTSTLGRHLETCFKYIGLKKKHKVLSVEGSESGSVGIISNF